jgi:CBS domain-containing protein
MTHVSSSQSDKSLKVGTLLVQDVMTRDVVIISPEDTVENAARAMTNFGISSLIAQSQIGVSGILTERDILTRVVASGRNSKEVLVRDVMTTPIIATKPNVTIETAVRIMIEHRIKKLPVVSKDDDSKIVGILSMTDVASLKPDARKESSPRDEKKPIDIEALVKSDEGQHLEFKSSLRYCVLRNEVHPELEFNCLKTICAFLNASGGDLIIGVSDSNVVVGIEADYMAIKKRNRDGFQNYLINQIANKIGNIHLRHIEFLFLKIQGREICQVHVEPSHEPAFLNHKGKQLFFVRTGNGSRPFNISEAIKYLITRWGKERSRIF